MNNCNDCQYLNYKGTKKFCTLSEKHQLEIKETKVICYSFTKKETNNNQLHLFT